MAVTLLLTGCSPLDVAAPASLSVDVTQGRTDRDARIIVMDVTNTGDSPIRLTRAELDTPQFVDAAVWSRGTTLKPGLTVSLRAELSDPVCPIADGAEATVTLDYTTESGAGSTTATSITVEPSQSTGVLAIIGRDDCIGVLVAEHADIRVADSVSWAPGAHQPASLDLVITSTGSAGSLEIQDARSTILLNLVDASGASVGELPLSLTVPADSPEQRVTLQLVPTRCDPHAVAEDKRGTIMILDLETSDGISGAAYYRSSDEVKASLYAFVADYCAA